MTCKVSLIIFYVLWYSSLNVFHHGHYSNLHINFSTVNASHYNHMKSNCIWILQHNTINYNETPIQKWPQAFTSYIMGAFFECNLLLVSCTTHFPLGFSDQLVALYLWRKGNFSWKCSWGAHNSMTTAMHGFNFISWQAARSNVSNMVHCEFVLSRLQAALPLPGACNWIECQRGWDVLSQ